MSWVSGELIKKKKSPSLQMTKTNTNCNVVLKAEGGVKCLKAAVTAVITLISLSFIFLSLPFFPEWDLLEFGSCVCPSGSSA